ncbi:MAG TPA: hypothetical protein PLD59_01760 [Tepidisphaeraceae bacterium]|nr:hypothetical protein [Tepidisphaeraceae bacterium]
MLKRKLIRGATFGVVAGLNVQALAQLEAYEGFDYPVGALGTQAGGTGFSSNWGSAVVSGAVSGSSVHQVDGTSLSVAGYPFATTGGHLFDNGGTTAFSFRTLAAPINMNTDSVRYMSFLLQKDVKVPDTGLSQIAQVRLNQGATNRFIAGVNSDESLRLTAGSAVGTPAGMHVGGVNYLYVVKFVSSTTVLEDQVFLQVFKDGETLTSEPLSVADWTLVVPKFSSTASWNQFNFVEGLDAVGRVDEIRIGASWADVGGSATPQKWTAAAGGNWSDSGNWSGGVPNSVDALANFSDAITGAQWITLDAPHTAGTVRFNNLNAYTVGGTQTLTLNSASGQATLRVQSGNHTISAPIHSSDDLFIAVESATDSLTLSGDLTFDANTNLTRAGGGSLSLKSAKVNSLTVGTGTMVLLAGADFTTRATSLNISGASNAWTGKLDINDNLVAVEYSSASPLATIANQILQGYAGGAWNGLGISSSVAAVTPAGFAIGFGEASGLGITTFGDEAIEGNAVLFRLTIPGDADLSGGVNLDDFTRLAAGFGNGSTWTEGDFNFDGAVNLDDFTALAANFGQSVSAAPARSNSPVPEPSAGLLFSMTAAGFLRRRR